MVKKIVWILVVAFLLFYLFTRPTDAADAVKGLFNAFSAVLTFFERLAS